MISDMMNYEIKEAPMVSEIRTEEVESLNPATALTKNFKFRLHNTGFLDSTSMVTFKLLKTATATAGNRLRLNCFNGCLGGIKRAMMSVGDFIIVDTEDVGRLNTLRHLNLPAKTREGMMGHYLGNQLDVFIDGTAGTSDNVDGADRSAGQYRISSSNGINYGQQNDGTGAVVHSNSITNNLANNDKYGIPLYMLFPCLENRQLPLFLFQDYPVILEIEFNDAPEYINNVANHPTYACADTDINIQQCKLVVDYVLPPASVIASYTEQSQQQGGYNFEYPRFTLVKKSLPAQAVSKETQEVHHRLGQEGKEVHSVIQMKKFVAPKSSDVSDKVLLGSRIDGVDCEEYQVEVNGDDVYRDFIYNQSSQYNEVEQVLGKPLLGCRPLFYTDPNTQLSHQAPLQSGLVGVYKPLCCDLTNGTGLVNGGGTPVVQGSPLIWKYKREAHDAIANIQMDYKPAMNVDYHIKHAGLATIKKLSVGTSVQVKA